ncbi:MAG: CRISPR-associated helicase Cas3' [Chloroflexi bacterium]|nr:CRISPR-associated helicase Cas3' [Chloroflexota bacterium]
MRPYEYQNEIADLVRQGKNIILQAPTGAGKTFASLWPFYIGWAARESKMPQKCVYAVPMRVLANQFEEEVKRLVTEEMRFKTPPTVKKQTGEYKEDPEFHADITFATIDQVLSSWLMHPYSLSARKGNLTAGAFVGSYLIFDEFHLFDPDSTLPTTLHMLKTLKGVSPFVLMTATFSQEMLQELAQELGATAVLLSPDDLQNIPSQHKTRTFHTVDQPLVGDDDVFIDQIVAAHLAQESDDQRSLVVCNQVERAQRVYQALTRHPDLTDVTVRLLHSRFLRADRQKIEAEVRREFNKERAQHTQRSMVLVGTQVVEVGLDMSSRALHTELAPAAAVLQRAGRCARYEGEVGRVYVYPVTKLHPYHEKEAKQQCALTWEWLQTHEGEHLDFTKEQALINHAHTPTDKRLLDGLRGTELGHRQRIEELWRGAGSRADAANLIRQIQAVTVVVHDNPDQLRQSPFQVDSFSLHPGTLQGKFKEWQERNEELDAEWDNGRLPWLTQKLVEVEDDVDAQGNRPIRYEFKPVTHSHELFSPLLVLHPALVGYSSELGLTLYPSSTFTCAVPQVTIEQVRQTYGYRLESYAHHIELVHQEFTRDWLDWVTAVSQRIENAYNWQPGIVRDMAQLIVCLHDAGKLSEGWQKWAQAWQTAVGNPIPAGVAVAHTDYDPTDGRHVELNRKMGRKRPSHAVESAYAAAPILLAFLPEKDRHLPLFRAAFTAIARHHGAFTSQPDSYQLVGDCERHVQETAILLPPTLQTLDMAGLRRQLAYDAKAQRGIEERFLTQSHNEQDMTCYMMLVRVLRFADQEGTKEGSK